MTAAVKVVAMPAADADAADSCTAAAAVLAAAVELVPAVRSVGACWALVPLPARVWWVRIQAT